MFARIQEEWIVDVSRLELQESTPSARHPYTAIRFPTPAEPTFGLVTECGADGPAAAVRASPRPLRAHATRRAARLQVALGRRPTLGR